MTWEDDRVTVPVVMSGADYRMLVVRAESECCSVEALLREAVLLFTKGELKKQADGSWQREYYTRVLDYNLKDRIISYD